MTVRVIDTSDSVETGLEDRRLWALDQLLAVCRNGSIPKDDNWIASILDFLLLHGLFVVRKTDRKRNLAVVSGSSFCPDSTEIPLSYTSPRNHRCRKRLLQHAAQDSSRVSLRSPQLRLPKEVRAIRASKKITGPSSYSVDRRVNCANTETARMRLFRNTVAPTVSRINRESREQCEARFNDIGGRRGDQKRENCGSQHHGQSQTGEPSIRTCI